LWGQALGDYRNSIRQRFSSSSRVFGRKVPSRLLRRSWEIARSCSGMAKLRSLNPPSAAGTSRWSGLPKSVRDPHMAAGDVVVHGVVDQVPDELFGEGGVSGGRRRLDHAVDPHAWSRCSWRRLVQDRLDDRGEIAGLPPLEAALAPGEREQRLPAGAPAARRAPAAVARSPGRSRSSRWGRRASPRAARVVSAPTTWAAA
jgi:hypothetical protein